MQRLQIDLIGCLSTPACETYTKELNHHGREEESPDVTTVGLFLVDGY
jgi:hypothetical protein